MNTVLFLAASNVAASNGAGWVGFVHSALHIASVLVGVLGVAVLLWGIVLAGATLVRLELCRFKGQDPKPHQSALRKLLGFYLLLGLEFLIAADIIETIVKPDLNSLLVLGLIVVIRTVISFTLNWELRHEQESTIGDQEPVT